MDPTALVPYGRLGAGGGRPAEARWAYERAAPLQPRNAPLRVALGMVCVRLGDLPAGLAAFREAGTLDPANADARIGQGWALLLAGRPREAAAAWRPVIGVVRDPDTLRRMTALFAGSRRRRGRGRGPRRAGAAGGRA